MPPPVSLGLIPEKCHFPRSQQVGHLPCSEQDVSLPPHVHTQHLYIQEGKSIMWRGKSRECAGHSVPTEPLPPGPLRKAPS